MKKLIIIIWSMCLTTSIFAEEMCNVQICNKIERVSLNPLAHMSDNFNETCYDITLPKNQSQVGSVLSSDSRWYQGNPTKKSVTKIKKINWCR